MNMNPLVYAFMSNLIDCIKKLLGEFPSLYGKVWNLSIEEIISINESLKFESMYNQIITEKNFYELILDPFLLALDKDKFRIEKTLFSQKCTSCENSIIESLEMDYLTINLNNYLGKEFSLDDFTQSSKGESICQICKAKFS